jgi:hypothetical protein
MPDRGGGGAGGKIVLAKSASAAKKKNLLVPRHRPDAPYALESRTTGAGFAQTLRERDKDFASGNSSQNGSDF